MTILLFLDWFVKRWLLGARFSTEEVQEEKDHKKCSCCIGWVEKNVLVTAWGRPMYRNIHKNACSMSNLLPHSCFRHGGLPLPLIIHRLALGYWKGCLLAKTFASREEEFYFKKSLFCCEIYFCRFKEGVVQFECTFCKKFHTAC